MAVIPPLRDGGFPKWASLMGGQIFACILLMRDITYMKISGDVRPCLYRKEKLIVEEIIQD